MGRVLRILFALYLFIPSIAFAGTVPTTKVIIAKESIAQADILQLKDIAEIQAKDPSIHTRLQSISLGYAPQVGSVREIRRERIILAIAAAGFPSGTVQVESEEVILVRRASQAFNPDQIREAIERELLSGLNGAGATARLVKLDMPSIIEAPSGTVEVRVVPTNVKDIFSPFMVAVELWVDKRVARRFNVITQVEAYAQVYVASRDLPEGVRVRKEDMMMEARQLKHSPSSYIRDINQLRGVSTVRPIPKGEAVTSNQLISAIVIRSGDPVRIVGSSDQMQIAVMGEAQAAGRIGDRIQVKNVQSGTMLQAIVVDEGLVKIRF
jgi:flagella basal body P-ring formation protein FlgA